MTATDPGATFRFPVRVYYEDTDAAGDELLTRAVVTVVCLAQANWKPVRIPSELLPHMESPG